MSNYDFIIIGQGLAGSLLAWQLIQHQKSVLVLDNQHHASASAVAAGIINPITGHRINITENFDSFYQTANVFYQKLENEFKQTFLNPINQYRLLKNKGQYEYWQKRTKQPEYTQHLGEFQQHRDDFNEQGFGFIQIKTSAYVSVSSLLENIKQWLIANNAYQNLKLDYQQISVNDKNVNIGQYNCKQLIFCEGYQTIYNPWLKDLPFKLAKGEILSLKIPLLEQNMLNWGSWLIPSSNGLFKLGSNFAWNDLDLTPTDTIKNQLLDNLQQNLSIEETSLVNHQAGIRPTTKQRKPFIGSVKNQNRLYCFNGFGSKGCLIIPHYAQLLVKHLLENQPLPEEVTQWL